MKQLTESPAHVQMSLAAAMTLGLRPGRFYRDAKLHCINLLLTYRGGCAGNCAYCGLQRQRQGEFSQKSFIRVEWPTFALDDVLQRISERSPRVDRICISMVTHGRAFDDTVELTRRLQPLSKAVSLLMAPTILDMDKLRAFGEAGAEIGSVAMDAATEDIFDRFRGGGVDGPHKWDRYWRCLEEAVEVFGRGKAGCHLIVGLGETEAEMARTMQRVTDMGANVHLFSFYPEAGSALENRAACPPGQFRRMQLASYLIKGRMSTDSGMAFDAFGRLIDFGVDSAELAIVIDSGIPFMTSGCPGKEKLVACNRPFGDGPPGDIRSYPFLPNMEDIAKIKIELGVD